MTPDDLTPDVADEEARRALDSIAVEGERAAQRVADAFDVAGGAIANALGSAARSGELNFASMAESILQDLARIALEAVILDPLNSAAASFGGQASSLFSDIVGQRAEGGPVMAGAPYLVGEQGPEVFVPTSAGAIAANGPSQTINITIQASSDVASSVQRSERQITAAIARAAAAGGRLL